MEEQNKYDENTQRALERVRKMLALANDAAATEGERDNALRMAHATLAKYNLSLAEASSTPNDRGQGVLSLRSPPWARTVANAVATLFFCEYFFIKIRGDQRVKHFFIGRLANTTTAMELTAFVIKSIQNESGKRRRVLGADGKWQTAFIKGAAHKVYFRCQELRQQAEDASRMEAVPGRSLVLASVYATELSANQDWLAKAGWKIKYGNPRQESISSSSYGGYVAGTEYGAGISLNRQVNGKKDEVVEEKRRLT